MPSYTPTTQGGGTTTASGFAGTGSSSYSTLGITPTQAAQKVVIPAPGGSLPTGAVRDTLVSQSQQAGATASGFETVSVADALAQFNAALNSDPAFASTVEQALYDAGLFGANVYNTGQITTADIYNAYKLAVLKAAGDPKRPSVDQWISNAAASFAAQGGPKIKLPSKIYPAPLTSYDTMATAADAAYQQVFGHDAPESVKRALTTQLNTLEASAKGQEAQASVQGLLAQRQVFYPGSGAALGTPANEAVGGTAAPASGGTTTTSPAAAANGGTTGTPTAGGPVGGTQVTGPNGQVQTVTQGPLTVQYAAPPSATDLAIQQAKAANPGEYEATAIANAMQFISNFIGQK